MKSLEFAFEINWPLEGPLDHWSVLFFSILRSINNFYAIENHQQLSKAHKLLWYVLEKYVLENTNYGRMKTRFQILYGPNPYSNPK